MVKKRKQIILYSRVDSAHLIFNELKNNGITIDSFISASAVGYYAMTTTDIIYKEESDKGNDFLSNVCHAWEDVAHKFKSSNVASRVVIVRIGIILSKRDGALKKIIRPIKLGLGLDMELAISVCLRFIFKTCAVYCIL
jgi:NAD dependent epimerase/dehydratase family enzyme